MVAFSIRAARAFIAFFTLSTSAFAAGPSLQINVNPNPTVTVTGDVGTSYRVEYTTNLNPNTIWMPLSEITLSQSSASVVDQNLPFGLQRYYRSVVVQTTTAAGFQAGESYSFVSISGGITNTQTLVVSSAQTGWLIQPGNATGSSIQQVSLSFESFGPVSSRISAIVPGSGGIFARTNEYVLIYSADGSGVFESREGMTSPQVGTFARDRSLAGRDIAPAQLQASESFNFKWSGAAATAGQELIVVTHAHNGIIVPNNGTMSYGLPAVSLNYQKLSPVSASLEAIRPADPNNGFPDARTNHYVLVYSSAQGGQYQHTGSDLITRTGDFVHDTTLVGQSAALEQIEPGESYDFVTISAGVTNRQTLVISSTNSGWLIQSGNGTPNRGIHQVEITYHGPISSHITVTIPSIDGGATPARTNNFIMIFKNAHDGAFAKWDGLSLGSTTGSFVRNRALVGQDIAPAQLQAAESYTFNWTDGAAMTGQDVIVVNDTQNGILIQSGDPTTSGLQPVNLNYQKLSPVCGLLDAVRPADTNLATMARTNSYIIVFSSSQGGQFHRTGSDHITRFGSFQRDVSSVGQNIALPQLDPGESYDFVTVSAGITNWQTLVISATNSGWLIRPGNATPDSGIRQVALSYQNLGPSSSRIIAVIPGATPIDPAQTNSFLLLFDSNNGGRAELQNPAMPAGAGISSFVRDRALVGQDIAPAQLQAAESYTFNWSDGAATGGQDTVAVNDAQNGILIQSGEPTMSGLQTVNLNYQKLSPVCGLLEAVTPADTNLATVARTNSYILVFSSSQGGQFQRTGSDHISRLGTFQRNSAAVGQDYALPLLDPGESFNFVTESEGTTTEQTLVISATNSGWLIRPDNTGADRGIHQVALSYEQLGPIGGRITAVIPSNDGGATPAQTNTFLLLFEASYYGRAELQNAAMPANAGISRFGRHRSLVGQEIAPAQLQASESYTFNWSDGAAIGGQDVIVVNDAQNGILIQSGDPTMTGPQTVVLNYQKLSPVAGLLEAVRPADTNLATMARTNSYLIFFSYSATGVAGGQFQRTGSDHFTRLGSFRRDTAAVGQESAPAQLQTSESYTFNWSDGAATSGQDIIIVNDAQNGILIQSGDPTVSGPQTVILNYQKLSPVSGRLEAVRPADTNLATLARTNTYMIVFSSSRGGQVQRTGSDHITRVGSFLRDTSTVGQNILPPQLQASESYDFVTVSAGVTNLQTLVISATNSGWLIRSGNATPGSGIRLVGLNYEQLGPRISRITAVIPSSDGGATPAQTNTFLMLFNSTSSGYAEHHDLAMSSNAGTGWFVRSLHLVGQDIAPAQLQSAASYTFNWSDGAATGGQDVIVVNDAQNGILIQSGDPTMSGLQTVNLNYQKLSPVSGLLEAVRPADTNLATQARTNSYIIVFSSPQGGQFQRTGSDHITRFGPFHRDISAVGQNNARPQLDPGESYEFATVSAGITNRQTLAISASNSGWLIRSDNATPDRGIRQAALSYEHLGPGSSRITAVIPSLDGGATAAQTNTFLLLFDSTNGGRAELHNPAMPAGAGTTSFVRDRALVGQTPAGSALTPGALYSLTSVSASITNRHVISVSSQQSGWLAQLDDQPPANGFQQVSLEFTALGSIASRIRTIAPGDAGTPSRTNEFLLLYNAANSGLFEQRAGTTTVNLGEFRREVLTPTP